MEETEAFADYPPQLRSLLGKLTAAGYGDIFLDKQRGRHFAFEALANTTDPVVREIGQQLRDGTVSLQTLGSSEAYREVLERGIRVIGTLDPSDLEEELDQILDKERPDDAEEHDRPSAEDKRRDENATVRRGSQ